MSDTPTSNAANSMKDVEAQACEACGAPVFYEVKAARGDGPEVVRIKSPEAWFGNISNEDQTMLIFLCSDECLFKLNTRLLLGDGDQLVIPEICKAADLCEAETKTDFPTTDTVPPSTEPSAV